MTAAVVETNPFKLAVIDEAGHQASTLAVLVKREAKQNLEKLSQKKIPV